MENLINLLKKSDDEGTFVDSIYDLYFFIGIAKGMNDAKNGKGTPLEDFTKEREALYESYNRRFG